VLFSSGKIGCPLLFVCQKATFSFLLRSQSFVSRGLRGVRGLKGVRPQHSTSAFILVISFPAETGESQSPCPLPARLKSTNLRSTSVPNRSTRLRSPTSRPSNPRIGFPCIGYVYFLAFKVKLAYSDSNKLSCTEPFRLIAYARKNSKRLLCGLFL
jgi:hypothetical protein